LEIGVAALIYDLLIAFDHLHEQVECSTRTGRKNDNFDGVENVGYR